MIRLLLAAAVLFTSACGYVGEPMPPLLNIPAAITDLEARQIGAQIRIRFSIPQLTTEGQVFRNLGRLEIRAGETGPGDFEVGAWAASAALLEGYTVVNGMVTLDKPVTHWAGREIVFGVRVHGANGRASGWSNLVVVPVLPPIPTPANVRTEAVPQGVRVSWSAPAGRFRVFRRGPETNDFAEAALVERNEWIDTATQYGRRYEYRVQTELIAGETIALSEISEPAGIVPEDRFPPARPSGLTAVPSTASIELAWEPSPDPNLATYRIYRAAGDEPWRQIGESGNSPAFSDRGVEPAGTWRYSVSAVDTLGNESEKSEPAEATL